MPIEPRNVINSPLGLNLANLLGKFPSGHGHRVAHFVADRISSRKDWALVRAVRCNQWVIHRDSSDHIDLDQLVKDNFRNTAIAIFDFYHTINNPEESLRSIEPNAVALQLVQRPKLDARGLIVVGIHMGNFDMVFQLGGLAGVKARVITLQELNPAYQKQFEMRKKSGLDIVPASFGTMKQAIEYLRAGGLVISAMDRPDESSPYRPKFFGLPAPMPIHHVFLALKAHVPVMVAAIRKHPDDKYHIHFSDPIEMEPHPDRHEEILLNAEKILQVAEGFIRQDSSQWSMTFPVWPEMMSQVP